MKTCTKCKIPQDIDCYHVDTSSTDGYTSWCKSCRTDSTKQYYKTERGRENHKIQEKIRRDSNPKVNLISLAKQRAKRKGIDFSIKQTDFDIPENCPVLGIPLFTSGKLSNNSPTLDRVDNDKGYIKSNIRVISWRANRLKSDATVLELEKILSYMYKNLPGYRTSTGVRRQSRPTKYYTFNGKSQGLIDWAEEYGIPYSTLNSRVNRSGWSLEKALLTPVRKRRTP